MNSTSSSDRSQVPLDTRTNAYRSDRAAAHLRGLVEAPSYIEGRLARITAAKVTLAQRTRFWRGGGQRTHLWG